MPKGQQELPPSEHHFRWLLYVSVIVVAIGLAFLLYVQLLQPKVFSEDFAKQLLERHDPSLAQAEFLPELTEEEDGTILNDRKFTRLQKDNESVIAVKEAIVTVNPEENNKTLVSTYTLLGSKPLELGTTSRAFICPFDTYHNISLETTDRYYFIGLASNYIPVLYFNNFIASRPGGFSEEFNNTLSLDTYTNSTQIPLFYDGGYPPVYEGVYSGEPVNLNYIIQKLKSTDFSQVWYFNPDESKMYEQQLSELLEATEECREVAA